MNTDMRQMQDTAERNQHNNSFQAVEWLKISTTMVRLVVLISTGQILFEKDAGILHHVTSGSCNCCAAPCEGTEGFSASAGKR